MNVLLFTVPEVMEILNLGRTGVYGLIRTGELPSVRIGRSRRIPASALFDFVQSLHVDGNPHL